MNTKNSILCALCLPLIVACAPRVEVAVPDKPITINLNVKIEHEIRVKVEKDLEKLFSEEDDLF
ncbi:MULTISPECIES: YnbE family lipoprotein [Hahella]|uniref:YnbE family lipoprotein n=1 Tax=Hahella TaxID=158481 RepID=UPI0005A07B58|nr:MULTISPECIES: YnbE family lipoprotein [Hahella]AZZ90575.1 YnbE family lipoprotein [Hahella sp. KA22]MBU6951894.1 YnbE family lipoprotein [Hahella sp. HN01]MDG9670779.1 YnbE family lipoprotein [Hahella sp. CR1]QAY53945.1 YnbE family lipoprotein [Hahella sp. KA22]WLQ14186.1 YnbE family lipoprotein [Hahella sp. HNIBRBA332]